MSRTRALARRRSKVALPALREAAWLLREPGSGTREVVERALLPHLHQMRTELELGSAEAIKQAVAEGLGITCLSRHAVADQLALRRLVAMPTALPRLTLTFYLLLNERRYASSTLVSFIDHCMARRRAARA
jgi:DNA-binding transcriptional LysR family regulator